MASQASKGEHVYATVRLVSCARCGHIYKIALLTNEQLLLSDSYLPGTSIDLSAALNFN